jgi:hypothetical protein
MFENLLGMVLGSNHVLTVAYRAMWTALSEGYRLEIQRIAYCDPKHGPPLLAKIGLADGY